MCIRSTFCWIAARIERVVAITMELITDETTGKVSSPKLAAATGHVVGTFFFCYYCWTDDFDMQLWLIYYGVVVGHMSVDEWLQQKRSSKPETP